MSGASFRSVAGFCVITLAMGTGCGSLFNLLIPHPDAGADAGADSARADASFDAPPIDGAPADAVLPDVAPFDSSVMLDPAGQRFIDNAQIIRAGGTIDIDGDGVNDTVSTINPDGSTLLVWTGTSHERMRIAVNADGSRVTTADRNQDGLPDYDERCDSPAAGSRCVTMEDTDRDGVMDTRVTVTHASASRGADVTTVSEVSTSSPPVWQTVSTITATGIQQACDTPPSTTMSNPSPCTGEQFDALPNYATVRAPALEVLPHVFISRSGDDACNPTQIGGLQIALGQFTANLGRLQRINPTIYGNLLHNFGHEDLIMGCAVLSCLTAANVVALTAGPSVHMYPDNPHGWYMAFIPDDIARASEEFGELLAHEMVHFSGRSHDGGDPNGHAARDTVYACGRHINRCRAYAPAAGRHLYLGNPDLASSARDAALCAEGEHKADFDRVTTAMVMRHATAIQRSGVCNIESGTSITHAAPLCGIDPMHPDTDGACCHRTEPVYCDLSIVPMGSRTIADAASPVCIEACSAGGTQLSCGAAMPVAGPYDVVCPEPIEACEY